MRRSRTSISNVNAMASALLGTLLCLASELAFSNPPEPISLEVATPECDSDIVVFKSNPVPLIGHCLSQQQALTQTAVAYLIETARPGYTMIRQGPELALGRLHPEFVVRLANAIQEARKPG